MHRLIFAALVATTASLPTLRAQTTTAALSRQVFVAESSFAASLAQRDSAAFAAFLSPEAIFFGDTTVLRGKAAVVEGWRPFFVGPAAPFSWKPEVIEVISSGRLALSSGPIHDPSGRRIGTFNSVWRREPDGTWRVIFDKGCPVCHCARGS
jgi:ketosteroid isomerase-like protein